MANSLGIVALLVVIAIFVTSHDIKAIRKLLESQIKKDEDK